MRAANVDTKICTQCGAFFPRDRRQGSAAWESRKFCSKQCQFSFGPSAHLATCIKCGRDTITIAQTTHVHCHPCRELAKKRTPERLIWYGIKTRCGNPNSKTYALYGGRGIQICERWANSFDAFLKDMGRRPAGMSIDRIDNDGNYSPENCRWATQKEQANNQRKTVWVEMNGRRLPISEWAKITGIPRETIWARLKVRGWDGVSAVSLERWVRHA